MSERKEKDPFAEYDKFWDELNEIDEIKDDEDYFKEKRKQKPYTFNSYYKETNKNHYKRHNEKIGRLVLAVMIFFFVGIGFLGFFAISDFRMGMSIFFPIQSILTFIFFIMIVLFILRKAKYK